MDALVKHLVVKENNRATLSQLVNDSFPEEDREPWLYNLACAVACKTCTVKDAVDSLRKGENIFDSFFLHEKMRMREEIELLINGVNVEESIFTCGKCGCRRIYTESRQTRSADESATVTATCTKCGNKWTVSQK